MFLQTIRTKDKKTMYHGTIVNWFTNDEFNFVPHGGSVSNPWWAKLDYWDLIEGNIHIFKVNKVRR